MKSLEKDSNAVISAALQKAAGRCGYFNKIMVSISGGYDSDVFLDLLLRVCPKRKLTFVFFDTGIEYEATKAHLTDLEEKYDIKIDRQRAKIPVPSGCKKYGVPFLSKDASAKINSLQNNNFDFANDGRLTLEVLVEKYPRCTAALKWWCNAKEQKRYNIRRTGAHLKDFMIDNPPTFKISSRCCEGAKKQSSHEYEKHHEFDCKCMGLRKAEGGVRATAHKNCFEFDSSAKTQSFRPIWWFTDADKQAYVDLYGVVLSDCYLIYGMKRTGCAGCPFNSNFEEDLNLLKKYEPKLEKAANAIFADSYDYTRRYREYGNAKKLAKREARK